MSVIGGDGSLWGPSRKMQYVPVVVEIEDEEESKIQTRCDSTDTLRSVNAGENTARPAVWLLSKLNWNCVQTGYKDDADLPVQAIAKHLLNNTPCSIPTQILKCLSKVHSRLQYYYSLMYMWALDSV